jgi:hypothetical protein
MDSDPSQLLIPFVSKAINCVMWMESEG